MAIKYKSVRVPQVVLRLLRNREPDLFQHGMTWAWCAVLCDRLKLERPITPLERKRAGGRNRRGKGKHQQNARVNNGNT